MLFLLKCTLTCYFCLLFAQSLLNVQLLYARFVASGGRASEGDARALSVGHSPAMAGRSIRNETVIFGSQQVRQTATNSTCFTRKLYHVV